MTGGAAQAFAGATPISHDDGVYLRTYLQPFRHWLDQDDIAEIMVNQPGEVWIERSGMDAMERIDAPMIDALLMQRLAAQIARMTHQGISREQPLLAATMPDGARIQIAAPPATRQHWAMAIRRHRVADLPLDAFLIDPDRIAQAATPPVASTGQPLLDGLRQAIADRRTILISGGTSSGKTSFLNALLRDVPGHERIILVEDTPEIRLVHANAVGLVAVRGEMGEARIGTNELLQASLRLRPDRIVLGELRGGEAVSFLRAINTGHPGSFSTIHANTPRAALDQLALMVMQTGIGLGFQEVLTYARSVIDLVVQLGRVDGQRGIISIEATANMA
jgi:type IV secretion system protein VirB11